jgi:hypothetical protein
VSSNNADSKGTGRQRLGIILALMAQTVSRNNNGMKGRNSGHLQFWLESGQLLYWNEGKNYISITTLEWR